jgi:predicted amidophosphoribosyltransferase
MAVPNLWRTKKQRYRLQAELCPTCTQAVFPPREVCPHCHQPMEQKAALPALILPVLLPLPQPAPVPVAAGDD